MCVVIIPTCPCGYDGQLGATLPCIKAFALDRNFRHTLHNKKLWHQHFDKCEDCWTWWESDQLRGVPTPDCHTREFAFQDGKYQVFCTRVIKKVKSISCCEDCCGTQCKTGSGRGTVMQTTSAPAALRKSVTSTDGIDAAIATTNNAGLSPTANSAKSFTGDLACPSCGKSDRSDSSDGFSEMSHKSKAQASKSGLFCRAIASLKAFAM